MFALKACLAVALFACAFAEVIDYHPCAGVDTSMCTIHEVRVDPCPQAASHTACHIKRRRSHTLSFDYTPHFNADTVEAGLTWVKGADQELPLITMDKVGCKYTECPVQSGHKQTYTVDIPIESKFPLGNYNIKWQLVAPTGERCCFTHDIKLVR